MSGTRQEHYFQEGVRILRGDLQRPPHFYSVIAAAILGGDVLDHTRIEAAYPRSFAAVWERIERMHLTCSVCGRPLERGAKMPLRTDPKWDFATYTYRHHGDHLDTELRRVFVGEAPRAYPDAALNRTPPRGRPRP